jgi:CheY-like chemotaxis protein
MSKHSKLIKVLVADDEENVIHVYEQSFSEPARDGTEFKVVFCNQGAEAVKKVKEAELKMEPFEVIFLDIRMPPGIDGVTAAKDIRKLSPRSQIVMVTAYSDVEPFDISQKVPPLDKILYQSKPFHHDEIKHLTMVLSAKYHLEAKLKKMNQKLEADLETHQINAVQKDQQQKVSYDSIKPILDVIPCGIILTSDDETIKHVNTYAKELISYNADENAKDTKISDLITDDGIKHKNGKVLKAKIKASLITLGDTKLEMTTFTVE